MGNALSVPRSSAVCGICTPRLQDFDGCPNSVKNMDMIEKQRRPKPFGGLPSSTSTAQIRQIKLLEDHLDPQQKHLLTQRIHERLPEAVVRRENNLERTVWWLSWGTSAFVSYSGYQFLKKLRIKLMLRSGAAATSCCGLAFLFTNMLEGGVCAGEFKRYQEIREQVTLEVAGQEARRFMRYHRAPGTQRLDPEYRMRLTGGYREKKLAMDFSMRDAWVQQKLKLQYGEWQEVF